MNKEEKEFIKYCDKELQSIYSKINQEEKRFLLYVVINFNKVCERIDKAIEYIEKQQNYPYPTILNDDKLLEFLKGNSNE